MLTTQAQVRAAFWRDHDTLGGPTVKRSGWNQNGKPLYKLKSQNDYPADVRAAFVDYIDVLARGGEISEALAGRVTL